MSDRRRINGPASGTQPIIFTNKSSELSKPSRARKPNELRKIFLQTGLIPAASGSAYLELEAYSNRRTLIPTTSTIKLSCSVNGPKPLSRNATFSPNLQLSASIKFAPFATRQRRGYVRDNIERDLGSHLENALKGAIIPERWPKSAVEVAVTVLEGEEDCLWTQEQGLERGIGGVGLMNVLAGSITVAAAALADAKIDCLDLLTGGVAASIPTTGKDQIMVLDPCPSDHAEISAACVIGYLPSRDEVTEVWTKGTGGSGDIDAFDGLLDSAVKAAKGAHKVLTQVVMESATLQQEILSKRSKSGTISDSTADVEMKT